MKYKPDIKQVIERLRAFWQRDLHDRPPIRIRYPIDGQSDEEWTEACRSPESYYAYHENVFQHRVSLLDDALPSATVDMGPGFMGGVMGCRVRFQHGTSWSEHCLTEWSELDRFAQTPIDGSNPWIRRLMDTIEVFSERSRDTCLVGLALPLGPGDIMNALRGPNEICLDFYRSPEKLRKLGEICTRAWIEVTRLQLEAIKPYDGGYCDNYDIWSPGKTSYFANDISALVSPEVYREHLFPFDCRVAETLDTPWLHVHSGGVQIVPEFLKIPKLVGIQIVSDHPAGPSLEQIVPLLREIQRNHCLLLRKYPLPEIEAVLPELSPKGLYVDTQCGSLEEARRLLDGWSGLNW